MSYEEKTKKLIVGIDHGFAMMKHTHGEFSNGLTKILNGASIVQNTLIYGGQTYKIGEGRLPMKEDKVSDEDYFILTVAAICEEMKHFNTHEAFVTIAAGLPFSRYGVEKDAFQQYLNRSGEIKASLEGEEYVFLDEIKHIEDCQKKIYRENAALKRKCKSIEDVPSYQRKHYDNEKQHIHTEAENLVADHIQKLDEKEDRYLEKRLSELNKKYIIDRDKAKIVFSLMLVHIICFGVFSERLGQDMIGIGKAIGKAFAWGLQVVQGWIMASTGVLAVSVSRADFPFVENWNLILIWLAIQVAFPLIRAGYRFVRDLDKPRVGSDEMKSILIRIGSAVLAGGVLIGGLYAIGRLVLFRK